MGEFDRIKAGVFVLAGSVLLGGAVFSAVQTNDFLRRSVVVPGLVIAEPYGPHHVQVRFRTQDGQVVTYAQNGAVWLHTGQRVAVRYDPQRPGMDASVDQWPALWDVACFLGLLGSLFVGIGAAVLRTRPARADG